MRRALLLLALLIAAVAVGTQQWGWRTVLLPFASFKKPACGHLKISEYILTSSRVLLPAGVFPAAIHIKAHKVHKVARLDVGGGPLSIARNFDLPLASATVLDYQDLVISPGLIDTHTHMNEPGRESWEGMVTATKAAAAGGITTVVDMPLNSYPCTTDAANVKKKFQISKGKLWVDSGFWGGLTSNNSGQPAVLQAMADAGVLGFKSFMCPSGINDFAHVDVHDIRTALPFLKASGLPFYVHAEQLGGDHVQVSTDDPRLHDTWLISRPPAFEEDAIKTLISALQEDGTAAAAGFVLHIAHLSAASAVSLVDEAKRRGLPISVETCPHYLLFAAGHIPLGKTLYKCAPPLRDKSNQEELWSAVRDGSINSLASDHSPSPPELKLAESGDMMKAWGGISGEHSRGCNSACSGAGVQLGALYWPIGIDTAAAIGRMSSMEGAGLQYALPATWHGFKERNLSVELLGALWSSFPARLAGLHRQKGVIGIGFDADFVVWDPEAMADTSPEALFHKHKLTPYTNMSLYGRVRATFVRGQLVFEEGKGPSMRGCGMPIRRQ